MHGRRDQQTTMLTFVDLEERVPPKHPLRVIKRFADSALCELVAYNVIPHLEPLGRCICSRRHRYG